MEGTLTLFLKSFCDYSHWKYAVFWKLSHHSPMTLTWEDGYFGYQKTNEAEESIWSDVYSKGTDAVSESVQLLMTEMSHLKYTLGEGFVGKIALSGDHSWLFCEDIFTSKSNINLIPECSYEWLLQLASGIKTVVLLPVLPHGVLQFGSYEAVAEDLAFVANIRDKFDSIYCMVANTTELSSDMNLQDWSFSFLSEDLMEDLHESSYIVKNILKGELSDGISVNTVGSSWSNPTVPLFVEDKSCISGDGNPESLKSESENGIHLRSTVVSNDPTHIGTDLAKFEEADTHHISFKNENSFFPFPLDCELHREPEHLGNREAAELTFKHFSVEDMCCNPTLMANEKKHNLTDDLMFSMEGNVKCLLDAVVGNLCSASDDGSSSLSFSVMCPVTLPDKFTASFQPHSHSEEISLMVNDSNPRIHVPSAFVAKGTNEFTTPSTASFDGNSNILIDKSRKEFIFGQMQSNSRPKLSCVSKKKTRTCNTQKSRPRDRQLVMDRMKELRELVPDGGKCSIDNLLDRTIKHMLYLQNITSQAEKLKKCVPWEVPECKRQKHNDSHSGRSCAFDFKSEHQVCPIVIEDLECSGHMLIEMVCREHGLFLDIAQVIRRMELTILKGVLESRSSTTWARFTVEVPRGFHRMDVLCPLLNLLQFGRKPVSIRV